MCSHIRPTFSQGFNGCLLYLCRYLYYFTLVILDEMIEWFELPAKIWNVLGDSTVNPQMRDKKHYREQELKQLKITCFIFYYILQYFKTCFPLKKNEIDTIVNRYSRLFTTIQS